MGRENIKTLSIEPSEVFMVSAQMIDYKFEGFWETVILRDHTTRENTEYSLSYCNYKTYVSQTNFRRLSPVFSLMHFLIKK